MIRNFDNNVFIQKLYVNCKPAINQNQLCHTNLAILKIFISHLRYFPNSLSEGSDILYFNELKGQDIIVSLIRP
jgi:hypothetical protein